MEKKKTFYITTPIYYPSGKAHIGHSYCTCLLYTSFDGAYEAFKEMAIVGEQAGADVALIETMSDTHAVSYTHLDVYKRQASNNI